MTTPTVQPARNELLALAAVARPDLDVHHLAGVLADEKYRSLGHARVGAETTRMLFNLGDLRDLRHALDSATKVRGTSR